MKSTRRVLLKAMASAVPAFSLQAAFAQSSANTLQQIKERKVLRLGVTSGDPWYYKDPTSEKWSGVGVALGQQMAQDLGVSLSFVETTWGNAVAAIQANQVDVMFVLDATEARKQAIAFPDQPLFYYAQGVLLKNGLEASSWSDLDKPDLKIAVTLGSTVDVNVTSLLKSTKIERFANNDEAIAAFVSRRVDMVAQFHPALLVQQARIRTGKVIIPTPVNAVPTSAGVRRESDPTWKDWVGARIAEYYTSGKTQSMFETYMRSKGLDASRIPGLVKESWVR